MGTLVRADAQGLSLHTQTYSFPRLDAGISGRQLESDVRAGVGVVRAASCRDPIALHPPLGLISEAHAQTLLVRASWAARPPRASTVMLSTLYRPVLNSTSCALVVPACAVPSVRPAHSPRCRHVQDMGFVLVDWLMDSDSAGYNGDSGRFLTSLGAAVSNSSFPGGIVHLQVRRRRGSLPLPKLH
jgi:hypothetical protein